jgi:hypothetical protein
MMYMNNSERPSSHFSWLRALGIAGLLGAIAILPFYGDAILPVALPMVEEAALTAYEVVEGSLEALFVGTLGLPPVVAQTTTIGLGVLILALASLWIVRRVRNAVETARVVVPAWKEEKSHAVRSWWSWKQESFRIWWEALPWSRKLIYGCSALVLFVPAAWYLAEALALLLSLIV